MDLFGWLGLDLFGNDYVLCNAGEWLCTYLVKALVLVCKFVQILCMNYLNFVTTLVYLCVWIREL